MKKQDKTPPKPQAPVKKAAKKLVSKATIARAKANTVIPKGKKITPQKVKKGMQKQHAVNLAKAKLGTVAKGTESYPEATVKKFAGADKAKPFTSMYREPVTSGDPLKPEDSQPKKLNGTVTYPYVAIDTERHTAIVLSCVDRMVVMIPMSGSEMKKVLLAKGIFEADDGYIPLDYDVRRAAEIYLKHAKLVGAQPDALHSLHLITGEDVPTYTESIDMAGKKKEAAAKPSKAKGATTEGKAEKKAKGANGADTIEVAARGRKSPHSGKKIKVLSKETGAREGTKADIFRRAVLSSKTVDEAMAKRDENGEGPNVTTINKLVAAGIIELY